MEGCGHKPRITWGRWKLEEAGKGPRLDCQRDHGPADTLISGFWPPEPGKSTLLWFKPPMVWGFVTAVAGPDPPPKEAAVLVTEVAKSQVLLLQ